MPSIFPMLTLPEIRNLLNESPPVDGETVVIPLAKRLGADLLTPVSAFFLLRDGARRPFLLESVEGGEKLARYSFLGRNPFMSVEAQGRQTIIHRDGEAARQLDEGIFDALDRVMATIREIAVPGLPRLTAGAVGYLSYDAVRLLEHLPDIPPDDLGIPDGIWSFYDTIAAFDHVKHQLVLMASMLVTADSDIEAAHSAALERLQQLETTFSRPIVPGSDAIELTGGMSSSMSREAFEAAVETGKDHIREGDIFQVVLSQRFSTPFRGERFNLYRALRQVNPSPYLFYLDFDDFALVGSSPEVLVRVEGTRAELLPIAGTRPRGHSAAEDATLAEDLLADAKERAEHLMLVDLGRNDLGRICQFGSVHVDDYAFIERYSHVMHIVSSISGRIRDGLTALHALRACFPAGTVSGAPKVRAMEIIDTLEPVKRGMYAGTVGYLDFRGNLDTCITIRTMLVKDGHIHIQAGAGVVADSDPAMEFEETRNKAQALHAAIRVAAEELQ